jgi:hypothetical protein
LRPAPAKSYQDPISTNKPGLVVPVIPAIERHREEGQGLSLALETLPEKLKQKRSVAQVVGHLPNKHKTQGLKTVLPRKKNVTVRNFDDKKWTECSRKFVPQEKTRCLQGTHGRCRPGGPDSALLELCEH